MLRSKCRTDRSARQAPQGAVRRQLSGARLCGALEALLDGEYFTDHGGAVRASITEHIERRRWIDARHGGIERAAKIRDIPLMGIRRVATVTGDQVNLPVLE